MREWTGDKNRLFYPERMFFFFYIKRRIKGYYLIKNTYPLNNYTWLKEILVCGVAKWGEIMGL